MAFNLAENYPQEFEQLLALVKELAIVKGKVILSSGKEADYYVDLRRVSLHQLGAKLIGKLLNELTADLKYEAVGGLTMGADPVASAVMLTSSTAINAFLVRKTAKTHGMGKQVEGPDISGKKVLIVEDTTTTGNSPMTAVKAAEAVGATVVGVATIVDRNTAASQVFAEANLDYRYVFNLDDLGLAKQ